MGHTRRDVSTNPASTEPRGAPRPTFGRWHQQIRLAHGLAMLARGLAVSEVADAPGHASPSNFIGMFRRAFGVSPARYFSGTPELSHRPLLRTNTARSGRNAANAR
ncbi:helix-turn-helix domain-containing protein [Pseudomonas aeruginosa]